MNKRGSGILLHISSLPSPFGIGDLGPAAYEFVDFLEQAKQRYWQVLPLNPTNSVNGNSPYSSASAFAANTMFISPEFLMNDGLLEKSDISLQSGLPAERVDYHTVHRTKKKILNRAFMHFQEKTDKSEYGIFCKENAYWLEDFAGFMVFKEIFQKKVWSEWPTEIRDRDAAAMNQLRQKFSELIEKEKFLQYIFFKQWHKLKEYCGRKGISIIGDIPIYVTYDSADAWAATELFKLDENKKLSFLAGVPPDYFSKTGQLWGNPVYNWDVLKGQGYNWWLKRIEHNLKLFDIVRIDHFRGFVQYWQVPAGEKTAVLGQWQKVPAKDFFQTILDRFPGISIIAEDLGIITDDVKEIMRHFQFSGMKILLFAFGEDLPIHPYLPHNFCHNCVAYTGTHDNNTVKGWFSSESKEEDKQRLYDYVGHKIAANKLHWEFIRILLSSVADIAIIPLQDLLGLGGKSRMNMPGTTEGNWQWRFSMELVTEQIKNKLTQLTRRYARAEKEKIKS